MSSDNLLTQEIATLEQERTNLEKELAELSQGHISLEIGGRTIELELGKLELGDDLDKARLMLERKIAQNLMDNPLGKRLSQTFLKEQELRQLLDLPDAPTGLENLNQKLNRAGVKLGCGGLIVTPALTLAGLIILVAGLYFLFSSGPNSVTSNINSPANDRSPSPVISTTTALKPQVSPNATTPNQTAYKAVRVISTSTSSDTLSSSSSFTTAIVTSLKASTDNDLPSKPGTAGSVLPVGVISEAISGEVSQSLSGKREESGRGYSYISFNPGQAEPGEQSPSPTLDASVTSTPGVTTTPKITPTSVTTASWYDPDGNLNRVGQPPSNAGGYNGPHGAFLPPNSLAIPALSLTTPLQRALTEEDGDTLLVEWPRPFEVATTGAYPGELGNMLLLGTQSSLGQLRRLQVGDEIRVYDRKGNLFVYRLVPFSQAGQPERVVDLATESWVFNPTEEAVLTILVTPPQQVMPIAQYYQSGVASGNSTGSVQERQPLDDRATTKRLAYRAILSIYAPVPPTPFGTAVAVPAKAWQGPTPTPTSTPTPTATPTSIPTATPTPEITPTASATPEILSGQDSQLPGLPHAGEGGCAESTPCEIQPPFTPSP